MITKILNILCKLKLFAFYVDYYFVNYIVAFVIKINILLFY